MLKLGDIANAVAMVFLNTKAAAAAGVVLALITAQFLFGKVDLTMTLNGALADLVAITAEPAMPTPVQASLIGAATISIWVFFTSLIVLGILKAVVGISVTEKQEYYGVDQAECGMEAYLDGIYFKIILWSYKAIVRVSSPVFFCILSGHIFY